MPIKYKLDKIGDNMKKKNNILSIVLIVLTVLLGITTYYFYKTEFKIQGIVIYQYCIYGTVIALILTLSELISKYRLNKHIKKANFLESRLGEWNTISYRVKKAGEHAFNELPIGIIILSDNGEIYWSNSHAKDIFMSPLQDIKLQSISREIAENIRLKKENFQVEIYGKKFSVEYVMEYKTLYLTDVTEIISVKNQYDKRITALGYINVDNLENILSDFDVQERAEFMWHIVTAIAKWSEKFNAYVRAYSDNSYLIIMDKSQLHQMMKDDFSILDTIKTLVHGKPYKISLSIGIACIDENIDELSNQAKEQLEFAINRGGDQASVKIDQKVIFFGAKNDTAQSETKVTMRMKSEELQSLMCDANCVMTIGHKTADADAFGATLAIYKMAKALGKPAYIIMDAQSIDPTVQRIKDSIDKEYISLKEVIITPAMALARMTPETLLMVVDCQKEALLVEPKLVKKASKIGVIDHHRRGDDAIENVDFYLSSTAASSSVELIVELFEFMKEEITFDKLEATWLLLGIIVDTNNFIYRCTEKTFRVSSVLAKYGADMTGVKKYLKEELTEKITRHELIDTVKTYQERVGIAIGRDNQIFDRPQLAKISDEIISIKGVDVGITIGKISNQFIGISARSLGTINVQLLMEKMGGGGHFNNAAAQVKTDDIDYVYKQLTKYIDEYIEKEESMKVILIKDVKGHGKAGEIVDLNLGFANHLIRTDQAIVVSDENLKRLDEQKKQAQLEEERLLQEMKELKKMIEETPIKIPVKIGVEGKIFGTVSTKQIVDTFKNTTGIQLDKKKIKAKENINALGTYEIPIDLHKQITATIKVYVVERE